MASARGFGLIVLFARAPHLLLQGHVVAEEGTTYLLYAWDATPLRALLAPHQGYYSLLAKHTGLFRNAPPMCVVAHGSLAWVLEINGQLNWGVRPIAVSFVERRSVELADALLDKLSSLANITVTEAPDHMDTVTFGEAEKPLVEGTKVNWPQELTASSGGRLGAL